MNIETFVIEEALILIPVLYILGMILKDWKFIPDNMIPIILLFLGIVGALIIMGVNKTSTVKEITMAIIQGILVTGTTVYSNQLFKQLKKKESDRC